MKLSRLHRISKVLLCGLTILCLSASAPKAGRQSPMIAMGGYSDCSVTDEGLHCWGAFQSQSNRPTSLPGPIDKIAITTFATCALSNGKVFCWGTNSQGQLDVPVGLPPVLDLQPVSGSLEYICALTANEIRCWGADGDQSVLSTPGIEAPVSMDLGAGFPSCALGKNGISCWGRYPEDSLVPSDLGANIEAFGVGFHFACAVTPAGTRCWGDNYYGQLNVPSDLGHATQLAVGPYHVCALKENRRDVACWGSNQFGETTPPAGMGEIYDLKASGGVTCARTSTGMHCWGYGNWQSPATVPQSLGIVKDFEMMGPAVCVLTEAGVRCWNSNYLAPEMQELPRISQTNNEMCLKDSLGWRCSNWWNPMPQVNQADTVYAGSDYVCAYDLQDAKCWGGYTMQGHPLVFPNGVKHIKKLITDYEYHCALYEDDSLHCWGEGTWGQTNSPNNLKHPRGLDGNRNHACIIDDKGVDCWGGINPDTGNAAFQVDPPEDLKAPSEVTVGGWHACAVTAVGVKCWGDNTYGQTSVPTDVGLASHVVAGDLHTCALTNGIVRCWGDSRYEGTDVPTDLGPVSEISAGQFYSCAKEVSGKVRCWGAYFSW